MNIKHEDFLAAINWRYATKKFDPLKKINDVDWALLEESLRLSPSSYGLQPWKFLVVQNTEIRNKLLLASWKQPQIVDSSHLVVIATLKHVTEAYIDNYLKTIIEIRGVAPESLAGYRKGMVGDLINGARSKTIKAWSERQSYIAMGNIMNAAALFGIDTCPIEGIEPAKYDEILNLSNSDYGTVAVVALGYRSPEDKYQFIKKVRFNKNDIIDYIK